MRLVCLLFFLSHPLAQLLTVLSSGNWSKGVQNSTDDGGSPMSNNWLTADSCVLGNLASPLFCVWRFVGVQVPQGATIKSAVIQVLGSQTASCLFNLLCNVQFSAELSDNSAPLPPASYDFLSNRARTATTTTVGGFSGVTNVDVKNAVNSVVNRSGWVYGNSLTIVGSTSGRCTACTNVGVSFTMSAGFAAKLSINFTKTNEISRTAQDVLTPSSGNWQINASVLKATDTLGLGVAIRNVSIVGAMPTMSLRLETTALISVTTNGSTSTYPCTNPIPTVNFPNATDQNCNLPCVAGTNYSLILTNCWVLDQSPKIVGSLTSIHKYSALPTCFQIVASGWIEFISPIIMNATLLPYDGRPYNSYAGLLNATNTSQPVNDRNILLATFGAQHICASPAWLNLWLGTPSNPFLLKCNLDFAIQPATPDAAVSDYKTVACLFPACNQTMCPGGYPLSITMNYAGVETRGYDTLLYPTLPVVSKVQGCVDVPPRTSKCPTAGGTRINITMVEDPGWTTAVSVLVGGAPCTSVYIYPFVVTCLLPAGVGLTQTVLVLVSGYVSPSVDFVSYDKPKIFGLSGGLGCLPDYNFTDVIALQMCSRNGSSALPLTLTGQNFGAETVPISVTLNGNSLAFERSVEDPHGVLYVTLPAGLGARLTLAVTVSLQTDTAIVSYEPCPIGTDATCVLCGIGSYGILPPQCVVCPPGRFQALSGQSDCTFCPKGTFQPAPGRHDCVNCPTHMTSLGVGSSEIAACSACPITHYLAVEGDDHVCTKCAPNSIPISTGGCGCSVGYYDTRKSFPESEIENLQCAVCPDGGNCVLPGTSFETMGPLSGWWRSDKGTLLKCLDDMDCLGVQWGYYSSANASASCAEHRTGVLCAECDSGYQPSSSQGGTCVPCDSSALAWLWVSLLLVLLAIVVIGIGFWFHRRKKIRQQSHHLQSNEMSKLSSNSSSLRINSSRSRAVSEFVVATTMSKKKQDHAAMISTVKIVVGFLQILSSMTSSNVVLPSVFTQVMRVFAFLNFDFLPWASIRCLFNIDFYTRIYVGCLYPFAIVILLLIFVALPIIFIDKRDYQDEGVARRFRAQFLNQTGTLVMFCLFLLYPWITLQLLQFGICLRVDDQYFLMADMKEQCFVGEWMFHLAPVVVLFLVLSVGIPVTLGVVLYRSRLNLRTERVRERLGFLYQSYAVDCWWFELVEMSAKVALISIVRFFDPSIHAPLRMGVCYLYIVVVLLKKPYVSESLDNLSLFCMGELLMFSLLSHVLPLVGRWQGTYVDDILSAILLTLSFMLFLHFLFIIVKSTRLLLRHPLVRQFLAKSVQPSRLRVATQFGNLYHQHSVSSLDEDSSLSHSRQDSKEQKDSSIKEPLKPAKLPRKSASPMGAESSQKSEPNNMPPPYSSAKMDESPDAVLPETVG